MTGWNETAWFAFSVGAALKSALILGLAWAAARMLRRHSAAAQHLVWTAAAAALLAVPLLGLAVPALRVPVPRGLVPAGLAFRIDAVAGALGHGGASYPAAPATKGGPPVNRAPGGVDWRLGLILTWAAGFAAMSAQTLAGFAALRRARRAARPFQDPAIPELLAALGIDARVEALEAAAGCMPVSFGVMKPCVLLPADAAAWSEERRRVVLLHEFAHVRRGDHAAQLIARLALSLYWWNPLAWMAWSEFLKTRERAADDMVLACGAAAPDYAGHLLEIARTMREARAVGWAALAMARPSQLEGRLLAILDADRSRRPHGRAAAWAVAIAAALIVAPLAGLQAQNAPSGQGGSAAAPQSYRKWLNEDAAKIAAGEENDYHGLEAAATTAEAQRQFDDARALLNSSLAIREQTSGPQSASYGEGLLKIGDLESSRGNRAAAEEAYQKALGPLAGTPAESKALIKLGALALTASPYGDYDSAFNYFERAELADADNAGTALLWEAITRDRQRRRSEAETLYRSAIAVQNPDTPEAATIMESFASFLTRQNSADEAAVYLGLARGLRAELGKAAPVVAVAGPEPDGILHPGGDVAAPRLVTKVEPQYSQEARAAKYEGTVGLSVEIGKDGLAHNIRIVKGLGLGLDEKAVEAVEQWQFQPGTRGGEPVTVQAAIEVNFRLL